MGLCVCECVTCGPVCVCVCVICVGSDDEGEEGGEGEDGGMMIQDETQTNLLSLRRTIYLTIMSRCIIIACTVRNLQWSHSIVDTTGTRKCVLIREVSSFQRLILFVDKSILLTSENCPD